MLNVVPTSAEDRADRPVRSSNPAMPVGHFSKTRVFALFF